MKNVKELLNMAVKATLVRNEQNPKQIIGTLLFYDGAGNLIGQIRTLELPDKGNLPSVSCIPAGAYKVQKHLSPKFGNCFQIMDVPDRSLILFHAGNFYYQTEGCILTGMEVHQIDADANLDVKDSLFALRAMLSICNKVFTLTVVEAYHVSGNTLVY